MEQRRNEGQDVELRMIRDANIPVRYKRDLEEFVRVSREQLRDRIKMMIHFVERQDKVPELKRH